MTANERLIGLSAFVLVLLITVGLCTKADLTRMPGVWKNAYPI
jgi:hypothetical protein